MRLQIIMLQIMSYVRYYQKFMTFKRLLFMFNDYGYFEPSLFEHRIAYWNIHFDIYVKYTQNEFITA